MKQQIRKVFFDESGSPALEYALILGLVGLAIVAAMTALSGSIESMLGRAGTEVDGITFE